MLIVLFRSVVIVGLIMAYSVGVWQFINDYFGNEFKVYLERELKNDRTSNYLKMEQRSVLMDFVMLLPWRMSSILLDGDFVLKKITGIDLWNYDKSSIIENSVNGFCSSEKHKISC